MQHMIESEMRIFWNLYLDNGKWDAFWGTDDVHHMMHACIERVVSFGLKAD